MTGILRMPDELYWMDDFMTRSQHNANRFAAADELERLQTELDETRKAAAEMSKLLASFERDALRYQWLRQQHWSTGAVCVAAKPEYSIQNTSLVINSDRMDKVIDIEMELEGGKTKA